MKKLLIAIRNLFRRTGTIDKLIQFFDLDDVSISNCVTYYGNYILPGDVYTKDAWRNPKERFLKLGFGIYHSGYGDWGGGFTYQSCPIIEIWIDKDMHVIKTERHIPYYNGKPHPHERKIDRLYEKVGKETEFLTSNQKLREWIGTLFTVSPRAMYEHPISFSGILTAHYPVLDRLREDLEKREEYFANLDEVNKVTEPETIVL